MTIDAVTVWGFAGWTLAAGAVGLTAWALFWDRSRGRRRCPGCWYDLAGVPGLVCPECGRTASAEKSLHCTRRRWRWVFVGCLILLSSSTLGVVPRIQREGWFGAVPSTLLVWFVPVGDQSWESPVSSPEWLVFWPPRSSSLVRLFARRDAEGLWRWQSQVLLSRIFKAHPDELAHMVLLPDRWPGDAPLCVRLNAMYGSGQYGVEGVVVREQGSKGAWAGEAKDSLLGFGAYLAPRNDPTVGGKAHIEVRLRDRGGVIWQGEHPRTVRLEGVVTDYMTGVNSDEADKAVLASHPRLWKNPSGQWELVVDNKSGAFRAGCTVALRAEVLRDGVVMGTSKSFSRSSFLFASSGAWIPWSVSPVDWTAEAPADAELGDGHWERRLRGDGSLAMQDYFPLEKWGSDNVNLQVVNRFWMGEVTTPLVIDGHVDLWSEFRDENEADAPSGAGR